MTKSLYFLSAALLLGNLLTACSSTQDTLRSDQRSTATSTLETAGQAQSKRAYDTRFAVAASSSNDLALALGKLAQQKAIAREVKDWGKQLTDQHTQVEQQLQALAREANIGLPGTMSQDDRAQYDDVDDRKYFSFDKKFLRALKEAHERDIKLYTEASSQAANSELRAFAANTLPTLYQHLQTTEELYERADERD